MFHWFRLVYFFLLQGNGGLHRAKYIVHLDFGIGFRMQKLTRMFPNPMLKTQCGFDQWLQIYSILNGSTQYSRLTGQPNTATSSLVCPGIQQNAPISALIKPIGLCGTQNAQKNFGPDQQFLTAPLPRPSSDGRFTI